MKVLVTPMEDGTVQILVKRTLPKENPSRAALSVRPEDVPAVTERLVKEMRSEVSLGGA